MKHEWVFNFITVNLKTFFSLPVTNDDTISGKTIILRSLIKISPGKEIIMIISFDKFKGLRRKPKAIPKNTPPKVKTTSKCLFKN